MRTCLFVILLAAALPSAAQELPDAGLPDAAVDQGGADRASEESDTQGGPCLSTKDCQQAFTCVNARCVPTKPVTVGCSATPVSLTALGVLALFLRFRPRSVRAKSRTE